MQYIVKPKWKKRVVIEKIYKHEPSGKVCSFECWYRYENYIVTFAEGVDIGEVKTWEKLNLTDADIVVDYDVYEDADDISLPQRFEKQIDYMKKHDTNIVTARSKIIGENRIRRL